MILIKLGGSVITDKSVPLSFSKDVVYKMGEAIYGLSESEPVILVHGGGSFGHYYSVQYDMHTKPKQYSLDGFAIVRNSMVKLNSLILDVLAQCGLRTSGMCPVLYGDAMWHKDKMSYILSGDVIMSMLSEMLHPRLAVFTMDVDGLYTSMESKKIIPKVDAQRLAEFNITDDTQKNDVTGGMVRKVRAATEISSNGVDVFFVNGKNPDRLTNILHNKYAGTYFSSD